jgi:uncharacterized protein (DUF2267 family)
MDKDFALRIIDAIEALQIENKALKAIFKTLRSRLPPQAQIEELIAQAKLDPRIGGIVHEQFAPLRARIREESDLQQALQEFLKAFPPKKDVN